MDPFRKRINNVAFKARRDALQGVVWRKGYFRTYGLSFFQNLEFVVLIFLRWNVLFYKKELGKGSPSKLATAKTLSLKGLSRF